MFKYIILAVSISFAISGCSYGTYTVNERGSYPNQHNTCDKGTK